jgi:DNA-binding LacI/PurR family transcriptional regulator
VLPDMPGVVVDNLHGERQALTHLTELGHRRIAYCGASETWDPRQRRYKAFVQSARAAGLELDDACVIRDARHPDAQDGAEGAARLVRLTPMPSAIVFYNDEMAIGALNALKSAGYSVPRDISVVGFDDIPWASFCAPSLTTVRQPIRAMAESAVSILLDLLDDGQTITPETYRELPPELVVRSSTGQAGRHTLG